MKSKKKNYIKNSFKITYFLAHLSGMFGLSLLTTTTLSMWWMEGSGGTRL